MKVTQPSRLSREALTDAPAGEYVDRILEKINADAEQTNGALMNNLNFADNMNAAIVKYRFTHGTELKIPNPLKTRPVGIYAIRSTAIDGGTRYAIDSLDWRFIDSGDPKSPQQIGVTANYAFTAELLSMRNSADQVVATGDQIITYTTAEVQAGSGITYASGVFTVARGGVYQINVSYHYDSDGAVYTDVRTGISGNGAGYWVIGYGAPAGSRVPQQLSHALSLSAGGTFSVYTNHGAAGSRTIGSTAGDTRFQSRVSIARLSADTAAQNTVTLLVIGG